MKRRSDFNDLTGLRFNRLLVIGPMPRLGNTYQSIWHVRCDCGVEKHAVSYAALMAGKTQSCGCLRKEMAKYRGPEKYRKDARNPVYAIYQGIRQRCYNQNSKAYPHYGGRGINMCQRWLDSFDNFVDDIGSRPSKEHSIDRINPDGNYEPSNCQWATALQQSHNRRPTERLIRFEWHGEQLCLKEICRREWVSYEAIRKHLRAGRGLHEAVRLTRNVNPFVEDSKTLLQDPSHDRMRRDRMMRNGKKIPKKLIMANGFMPSDEEAERIKEDIWLRGCMERCAKDGNVYRGKLPSDYVKSEQTT